MERSAFPAFYREHVEKIYRFLLFRCGGSKEMAEDLTQDVFLKAFDAFERFDPEKSKSSWIFTIARNHLINQMQKLKQNVPLEDMENVLSNPVGATELLELSLNEKELSAAIEMLPSEDATLIRMKYLEGWAYDEIAEITGKSAGSLRIQSHRAMKTLRTNLKRK